MLDKMHALASVTAVAGFCFAFTVGGCSSSDPVGPSPVADGGAPDGKAPTPPPADDDDDSPEEACGPKGEAVTMAALDAELGWKPPVARQNACTADDLAAIKAVNQASSTVLLECASPTKAESSLPTTSTIGCNRSLTMAITSHRSIVMPLGSHQELRSTSIEVSSPSRQAIK